MYPGQYAQERARQPAFIMAGGSEVVTYGELERRSNQLAHLLRRHGLERLDHFAIFMENNSRYLECCAAGERSGLYYTSINSYLTAAELAYVVNNSRSKALITSRARHEVALQAIRHLFFLPDNLRGDGLGSRLLRLAEDEARQRGCVGAVLYTINFQAPGFYERHGYRVLGTVPCLPPGTSRIFMTKPLT